MFLSRYSGLAIQVEGPTSEQYQIWGIRAGVIAAQLGHADTRMTEKHYAHLAPSYVADTIRAQFPTLGIVGDTAVTSISRRNK